jgi:hypothetical protein
MFRQAVLRKFLNIRGKIFRLTYPSPDKGLFHVLNSMGMPNAKPLPDKGCGEEPQKKVYESGQFLYDFVRKLAGWAGGKKMMVFVAKTRQVRVPLRYNATAWQFLPPCY